ncbi:MAG: DNA-3-methyladenine glycosylase I [Rhodospirillaceae bacterium]
MNWYCNVAPGHELHGPYHDDEYGFPVRDDRVLFERLCLEIFQAGLSWELILRRRPGLNAAFHDFEIDRVAAYGEEDVARLLNDARIIRNRLKVAAIIDNARRIQVLRAEFGGFAGWLDAHHPQTLTQWVKLFRKTFAFTGPEVVNEFLMSIGLLPGGHSDTCPVQARLAPLRPPWIAARDAGFDFKGEKTK